MDAGGAVWIRSGVGAVLAGSVAATALKRRSLDLSGALAGFVTMAVHIASDYRFGVIMLVFFLTSSKLTKLGREKKKAVDEHYKEGGQRNWIQVMANSAVATVLAIAFSVITKGQGGCLDSQKSNLITTLIGGVIGHYACCNGDTWSSEIGVLSKARPRLITTFKHVRTGTNGAVSLEGLAAALAAGSVIGLAYVCTGLLLTDCPGPALHQLQVIAIAAISGLFGSVLDSILGATLQFSGYCTLRKKVVSTPGPTVTRISGTNILDNNAVNFVTVVLTTLGTAIACQHVF